ncbi:MAG: hypothetical protein AABX73_01670 [Nanoarchaeota archaeon]|mgnify:CR=1 FL=1
MEEGLLERKVAKSILEAVNEREAESVLTENPAEKAKRKPHELYEGKIRGKTFKAIDDENGRTIIFGTTRELLIQGEFAYLSEHPDIYEAVYGEKFRSLKEALMVGSREKTGLYAKVTSADKADFFSKYDTDLCAAKNAAIKVGQAVGGYMQGFFETAMAIPTMVRRLREADNNKSKTASWSEVRRYSYLTGFLSVIVPSLGTFPIMGYLYLYKANPDIALGIGALQLGLNSFSGLYELYLYEKRKLKSDLKVTA